MKVAVVTPSIGSEHLIHCLSSVYKQTYQNLSHYIFIDGRQYGSKVKELINNFPKARYIELEENVGKDWYGHRVYAACSFLVDADVICYLDEDNWIDPDHVEELVKVLNEGNDWAYSLRKIYDKNEKFICEDNCESLGKWPVYFNDKMFHIDTSSFAIRRNVAVGIGHSWYGQWGADRQFFGAIKQHFPKFDCTTKHTLCYRLDGNANSVKKDFFENGNLVMYEKHKNNFPWLKKLSVIDEIGPGIKIVT